MRLLGVKINGKRQAMLGNRVLLKEDKDNSKRTT